MATARRAWVQGLQLAPLLVVLFLLTGGDHPGHDCDRKGSDLGLGIFVSLVLFQLPLGTLSLIGLALGLLIDLWRNKSEAQNPIA